MIPFESARTIVGEAAQPLAMEPVPLVEAAGRVLAEPAVARITAPRADVSTMDGYAVRTGELGGEARLRVVGESWPNTADPGAIGPGECARIFTGAPLPPGADRVVMQEVVRRDGDWADFNTASGPRFVRAAGSDFRAGDVLFDAGARLGPRQLVAAAAGDLAELIVWRRPRVAVLATGDELAPPGAAAGRAGAVPESISAGLAALVEQWGGAFVGSELLPDDLVLMRFRAAAALDGCDLLLVIGGASVGERDFGKRMIDGLELRFARVAMKPGKPVWFGSAGGKLVMGLPGNPTSALVTARLLAMPLVAGLAGRTAGETWRQVPLAADFGPVGDRETFARGWEQDGRVRLAPNQDSGAQRTLAACDLLARLPTGTTPRAGEDVQVLSFDAV